MQPTFEQLTSLRDNLDGLGYCFGPRGLYGIGNEQKVFDAAALGGGKITPANSLRSLNQWDTYTRAAIYQFQRDQGIAATGTYGNDLRDRLERVVRNLQNNLKITLGKPDPDLITGYYGSKTFQYIKEYQTKKTLPVTGIATPAVQTLLNDEALRLVRGEPAPSPTPAPPPPPASDLKLRLDRLSNLKGMYERGSLSKDDFIKEALRLIP